MKTARWAILLIAAVLLASVGWIYLSFRRDIVAQQARITTGSQMIDTRCGPIEVAEAGQGQPLLIVHGTGGGFDQAMLESDGRLPSASPAPRSRTPATWLVFPATSHTQ